MNVQFFGHPFREMQEREGKKSQSEVRNNFEKIYILGRSEWENEGNRKNKKGDLVSKKRKVGKEGEVLLKRGGEKDEEKVKGV